MEVGDEEKSEEMPEKIYPSAGSLEKMEFPRFSFFAQWRWEMSRKVKKWKKSYPSAGRLVKMGFSYLLSFNVRRWDIRRKVKK